MTEAVVLVGVAVSAVAGCVTVRGEAEPQRGPDAGASRAEQPEPEAGRGAEPRMGRPEVRQEPSRPLRRSSGARRTAPADDRAAPERWSGAAAPGDGVRGGGEQAGAPPAGGGLRAGRPEGRAPAVPPSALRELTGDSGVCDLGRKYGGWAAGSPQHHACRRAYGS